MKKFKFAEKMSGKKKWIVALVLICALVGGGLYFGLTSADSGSVAKNGKDQQTEETAGSDETEATSEKSDTSSTDTKSDSKTTKTTKDDDSSSTSSTGKTSTKTTKTGSSSSSTGSTKSTTTGSSSSSSNSGSSSTTKTHTHNWVAHYTTVPVYDDVEYAACNVCNATFSDSASLTNHLEWECENHPDNPLAGGYRSVTKQVQTGTQKVVDYYYCSGCGAHK